MNRKEIIQEMQMCLICAPFFEREKNVLAHEIGFHVRKCENGAEGTFKPANDKLKRAHLTL